MSDLTIPQDIIDGVLEIMDEVGWNVTLRYTVEEVIDNNDPGADYSTTPVDHPLLAFLYNIEDSYVNETTILTGDLLGIVSISGVDQGVLDEVAQGNIIISLGSSYRIVSIQPIIVSGVLSTILMQLRA